MKKLLFKMAFLAIPLSLLLACDDELNIHNHNTNIRITDSDDEFQLSTNFSPEKTKKIRAYINNNLSGDTNIELGKGDIDATITLDDNTVFYLKSSTGKLKIKLDKNTNSHESYYKVKKVCDGIKDVLKD